MDRCGKTGAIESSHLAARAYSVLRDTSLLFLQSLNLLMFLTFLQREANGHLEKLLIVVFFLPPEWIDLLLVQLKHTYWNDLRDTIVGEPSLCAFTIETGQDKFRSPITVLRSGSQHISGLSKQPFLNVKTKAGLTESMCLRVRMARIAGGH